MSSPTSSNRRTGPIGIPKRLAALVDGLNAHAIREKEPGLVQIGPQDAVHEKSGAIPHDHGNLVHVQGQAVDGRDGLRPTCANPRITSTSGMRSTGLKKCIPPKSWGRSKAVRPCVSIDSDDVFEVSTQPSFTSASTSAKDGLLDVHALDDGLDDQIGLSKAGVVESARDEFHLLVGLESSHAALLYRPVE